MSPLYKYCACQASHFSLTRRSYKITKNYLCATPLRYRAINNSLAGDFEDALKPPPSRRKQASITRMLLRLNVATVEGRTLSPAASSPRCTTPSSLQPNPGFFRCLRFTEDRDLLVPKEKSSSGAHVCEWGKTQSQYKEALRFFMAAAPARRFEEINKLGDRISDTENLEGITHRCRRLDEICSAYLARIMPYFQ